MCFSPEKDLKTLKINWVFMTVKPQMDIAIAGTHNFSFNFGCLFYHVWLIKDSEQPHHRKATDSGCPKALLHHTHEVITVQGASFIYSHLAFRKKLPRGKLALKNSCIVSLSKGRYWFGVLGRVLSFFFYLGWFWFFPISWTGSEAGSHLGSGVLLPTLSCGLQLIQADSQAQRKSTCAASPRIQPLLHHSVLLCFPLSIQLWTLYAFHSTGFYTHTI